MIARETMTDLWMRQNPAHGLFISQPMESLIAMHPRIFYRCPGTAEVGYRVSNVYHYSRAESVVTGACQVEEPATYVFDHALGSLLWSSCPGTGGLPGLEQATAQGFFSASGACLIIGRLPALNNAGPGRTDVSKELAIVRHFLSLNTTNLSHALKVERPTVYAWLDDKWNPKPENRARLRELFELAQAWRGISNRPLGRLLWEPLDNGQRVIDLLSDEPLRFSLIKEALIGIRHRFEPRKAEKTPPSIRAIAKERGFRSLTSSTENERFDRGTRS
jgi:hypothetical protein